MGIKHFLCHECAEEKGHLKALSGPDVDIVVLGSAYQRNKFEKHTEVKNIQKLQSVFTSRSSDNYKEMTERALKEGFVGFDDRNRKTFFLYDNRYIGSKYKYGGDVGETDTIVVARSTSPDKIHSFSESKDKFDICMLCNRKLISNR